jgi:uncharacterized membrane protein
VVVASVRRESPTLGTFFSGLARGLSYLGAFFLVATSSVLALIPVIVPGVIVFLGMSQATYLAVDRRLGPIEAVRASWQMTRGLRARILVVFLLEGAVGLAGLAACGVGLIVATPVILLMSGVLYLRLLPRLTMSANTQPAAG